MERGGVEPGLNASDVESGIRHRHDRFVLIKQFSIVHNFHEIKLKQNVDPLYQQVITAFSQSAKE